MRSREMDIIKGIGIILVVSLHVGLPNIFLIGYFNLFHMAIFFFAAGGALMKAIYRIIEEENF